ncbi:unhealthy ribosome biogenesis protein 2 homolog isoform X2 [Engystomops pustulosus]|uniref:unhealthy ribosome biogenesis protein 2 homolog isoform X2 n=1 Tax=Engystomops pustulosus TaxID=76066 RepID=UPI003AFA0808
MAGIYSGIHLKLKNPKIAWEHKLKLAHFAWISHQCFIPNKEQFLLDWVSQTLVGFYTKKLSLEEDVEQKLWIFLDSILHSKRLQKLMEDGKSLKLRFVIAQVMNDIFALTPTQSSPPAGIGTVLSCCQGVLSSSFGIIYRAKYELMVELLGRLCFLACHCLTYNHANTLQVLNVLSIAIKQYAILQRQQSNRNRLFTHVVTQLFEPCLLLRNAFNNYVFDKDRNIEIHQLVRDVGSNIEIILQTGLFQAELLNCFKEELLSQMEKSEKKKGPCKDYLTPVSSMLAKLEKIEWREEKKLSLLAYSVPFLYKLFLDSYCRDGNEIFCFQMLVKLFRCLCTPFTIKQEDLKVSFSQWSIGLNALENMLNLVLDHNIYNIAEDNIKGNGSQYKFFRSLTEILVCDPCTLSLPWFNCLKTLNSLNHFIVEPDLSEILRACFNADVSDIRIKKSFESLIGSLLLTYTKLRQFPKLFEKVLLAICQLTTEKLSDPVLLSVLTNKLKEFLVQIPSNQMLDMWVMVLEKWQLSNIKDDPSLSFKLEHLASLLHCLMMNIKSLDNNTPVPVLQRFQNLMKQISEELILPSLTILTKNYVTDETLWLQKICKVALMLLYTWIEVNTVTALNCDKYLSQMCKLCLPLDLPLEHWDFSIFFEDKNCWKKIYDLCRPPDVVSMFYLGLLSIQKIKLLLMHIYIPNENERLTVQASASFFVNSGISILNHKDLCHIPYSGNINSNNNSLPVAQWHFIVSNITILLPYISFDDMNNIATLILETHLPVYDESKKVDNEVTVAFREISKSFLQSDSFSEMCILQSIFITSILNRCAMLLTKEAVFYEILDHLSFKDSYKLVNPRVNDSYDDSMYATNMKNALQLICSLPKMDKSLFLSDPDIKLLSNLIELISMLKLDSLPPSDLCRCFFFLLTFANASFLKSPYFASVCYKGLTCLLNGTHANHVFKIAYASDILKVVMAHTHSAHWNVTDLDDHHMLKLIDTMNEFFDTFLSLVIKRKQSVRKNLEQCTSFMLNSISNTERTFWSTFACQLHIVTLKNLCHHLTFAIQEHHAKGDHIESFNYCLKQTAAKLKTVIQQSLDIAVCSPFLPTLLVTSTTTLFEAERCMDGNLKNIELYRVFFSQIMKELCYAQKQNAFLKAALHYLTLCISEREIYLTQQLATSVFIAVGNLLASPWFNKDLLHNAEIELQHLLNGVTENCSCEEFHTLLKFVFQKLEVGNLWRQNYKTFNMEACKERLPLSAAVLPVLETIALFLRRGETLLSNPHHVTLSLSTLLMVSLENVKAEDYYSIILAIHEVLFSVLQCHTKVMLKSVPTFLSCFHRLVASVMHEGRQKGDKGGTCIAKCVKLVKRMYTHIAAKTEEFTVFSTFIVSQYIHELQKVTLQPEVRTHLTEGIFPILDLCIDRDVKFLNMSLQTGAREVFKELYQDYTSHYKTRNQEEEKYTV